MSPRRLIVGFLACFVIAYAMLIAPWPRVHETYRDLFAAAGTAVFRVIGPPGGVRLQPHESDAPTDTTILVTHQDIGAEVSMGIASRQVGYLPTAVLIALVVATPLRWTRRLGNLAGGLLAVHAFVAVRLWTMILYGAYRDVSSAALTDPTLWDKTVASAVLFMGVGQPLSYIVPILIWGLLSFVGTDLLLRAAGGPSSPKPAAGTSPRNEAA